MPNSKNTPAGSLLQIAERVLTEESQVATSENTITLAGANSSANMLSRLVMRGHSRQDFSHKR